PRERAFEGDPAAYATRHRLEILGELAGLVERWKLAGRPLGQTKHRCVRWSQILGGILGVAGLDSFFLGNLQEVEATMDEGQQALADLAEDILNQDLTTLFTFDGTPIDQEVGLVPKDWVPVALRANVYRDALMDKTPKGQATWMGTFLSARTCREVEISTKEGLATAKLFRSLGRSNQKRYWFQVTPKDGTPVLGAPAALPTTAPLGLTTTAA